MMNHIQKNIASVIVAFLTLCSCNTQDVERLSNISDAPLVIKLDKYLTVHCNNRRFNGNILITKGDSVIYEKSYGLANIEFAVPNSNSTKFLIGSITKPFTAYAILLLENQGKLSIDDRLSKFFPDFPNSDKVSIKHLLTHTSGITDYHAFISWKTDSKLAITPEYTLNTLIEKPYMFESGERFSYTNSGYIFLGLIIEKVSNQTFEDFIQKEILDPLELSQTGIASNTRIIKELATGYTTTPKQTFKSDFINYNQPFASGNMYSTPTDLRKFTKAVMNSTLLPVEKTNAIFNGSLSYGYGWGLRNYDGIQAYGHFGAMNGFVGAMTYLPENEYFICFLTNDDNTPEYTIMEDLVDIINGKEVINPEPMSLMQLSNEMKTMVIGDYLVKQGDTLSVFELDNRLFLKETGQMKHELFPIDSLEYTFTLFEFNAVFSEPVKQVSDTLRFIGKSNVVAKRITVPNSVYEK